MQLRKVRKRGRCAAALPADQWVDNALCCFKLGASAGCSPPYGWLRKSCFSRRHTEAPAFAGASLSNRCSSCPTQPPATMSGAQYRAHPRRFTPVHLKLRSVGLAGVRPAFARPDLAVIGRSKSSRTELQSLQSNLDDPARTLQRTTSLLPYGPSDTGKMPPVPDKHRA